jgi:hypothetical protein
MWKGRLTLYVTKTKLQCSNVFQLISDAAAELAPELQVVVLDHADLKTDWLENSVIERWRGGSKLVPQTWLTKGRRCCRRRTATNASRDTSAS